MHGSAGRTAVGGAPVFLVAATLLLGAAMSAQAASAAAPFRMFTLTYENTPSPHDDAVIGATTTFWNAYLRGRCIAVPEISRAGTVPGQSDVIAVPR